MKTSLGKWTREFDFTSAGKWLALGIVVGAITGVAAMLFQEGIQAVRGFFMIQMAGLSVAGPGGEQSGNHFAPGTYLPWMVVLLPAVGGLVAGAIVFLIAPEAEGHGTDAAINAYHRKLGFIRSRVPLVKLVASAVTLGSGGSGGREGPIALIGAGVGSFLATRLGMSARMRRWLLAAGIGAGIGSIFRAPLAGALFAAEVLYSSSDVETEVLLPAVVSSIVAYSVYAIRFGWGHMFTNAGAFGFDNPLELGPYGVLAVVVALAALIYVKTFYGLRDAFGRLGIPDAVKPMIGGALTGVVALLLIWIAGSPTEVVDVMSSGYGIIQRVISSDGAAVGSGILLLIAFGKILTTSLTIGSGGSAGVFGPSMVIGATLGAAVGKLFHLLMPGIVAHPTTFAIVGMAGFFAAAANTPISTLVMVSELTGNYELLMPSMWVCALAFLVGRRWSIYQSQVPSKHWSPAHVGEYVPEVFAQATVGDVFRRARKYVTLRADMNLREVLDATAHTRQRLFPVLDADGRLAGAFRIDEVAHFLQDREQDPASVRASELIHGDAFGVHISDRVERAQKMLRNNAVEELLVFEDGEDRRVAGIITGADILLAYTRGLSRRDSEAPDTIPPHAGDMHVGWTDPPAGGSR